MDDWILYKKQSHGRVEPVAFLFDARWSYIAIASLFHRSRRGGTGVAQVDAHDTTAHATGATRGVFSFTGPEEQTIQADSRKSNRDAKRT